MNKADLQELVNIRLKEAEILLKSDYYSGAYYLMGYALECACKACIAKNIKQYDFPNKELLKNSYTHDLSKLIGAAGLKQALEKQEEKDGDFKLNWGIAKDWSTSTRYSYVIKRTKVEVLFNAITHDKSGILTWLKTYW